MTPPELLRRVADLLDAGLATPSSADARDALALAVKTTELLHHSLRETLTGEILLLDAVIKRAEQAHQVQLEIDALFARMKAAEASS